MSIPCEYSLKEWNITLSLLQRAKDSKKESVETFSGFRKIEAQRDTKDIGQTGNNIKTIDLAIGQIRHEIGQKSREDKILILLDLNMYHLIERLRRRKFKLNKPKRQSKKTRLPR